MAKHPLIFICSPYRGNMETNARNARSYCRLACTQGGIPFAPHLLFTQFLNDSKASERNEALALGLEMLERCDELWVFGTLTAGMACEVEAALRLGKPIRRFDAEGHELGRQPRVDLPKTITPHEG